MVDFTKSDLKTGMVVESRNGDKYLVIRGDFYAEFYSEQKTMFIASNSFMPGSDYNSSLKIIDEKKDYDIVKVYKPDIYSLEGTLENCNDSNLIWEREPEVDWSEVPVDTKILVRNFNSNIWTRRHFAEYKHGKVCVFDNGLTSWTTYPTVIRPYDFAKLAKDN